MDRVRLASRPRTKRQTTLLDACADAKLFGDWFKNRKQWQAWFAFIAALFGLPMTAEQLAIYRECTGREDSLTGQAEEGWLVVGRRGGKSFILALLAVYIACFKDHRKFLAPGERGTVMIVAQDRKQTRIIMRYIKALLAIPILKLKVEGAGREAIDLDNKITIEVHTASYRSTRGYAAVAVLADEVAVWPTEDAAEPDYEVLNALRPGMAQFPDALLLCASSPYAMKGALYDAHKAHYGKNGDPILVWQAPTRRMNPTIRQQFIDRETEKDPASAAAEYGAMFRSDVAAFVAREVIDAAVVPGRYELPPQSRYHYVGFVDPSGGSADSMTLAISHREGDAAILDAVRELRPPFSPENAVDQFANVLKSYGIKKVVGDSYAGQWPRERFKKCGVSYEVAELHKSDIYRDALPLLNSRRVELLDHPRLTAQLCGLERRTARGGRDSIDHARNSHDDLANAVTGALTLAAEKHHGMPKFSAEFFDKLKSGYRPQMRTMRSRFKQPRAFFGSGSEH